MNPMLMVKMKSKCEKTYLQGSLFFIILFCFAFFIYPTQGTQQSEDKSGKVESEKATPESNSSIEERTEKDAEGNKKENLKSDASSDTGNDGDTGLGIIGEGKDGMPELPPTDTFSFIKSVMALSFVLGLIFLVAYFFKRITGVKTPGFGRGRVPIDIIGNMPLGDRKYLTIVQIQDKHYFLGITPDSIRMLSELQLELPAPDEVGEPQGFDAFFQKAKDLLNRNSVRK